jgi:hypothetical protein
MRQEDYGKQYAARLDIPVGLALAIGYLAVMLWSPDPGFCRDEIYYFNASHRYMMWILNVSKDIRTRKPGQRIRSFTQPEIKKYWAGYGNNHEHPPLAKLMMGASWWFFTQSWRAPPSQRKRILQRKGWLTRQWHQAVNWFLDRIKMNHDRAFRFPGMCWGALIIFIVYIWGTQAINRRTGLFAALAMMLLPRFFFHAQLAEFDVPISALWLLVIYAFWRGMKSGGWALLTGVFFGLALATKHNSWILPGVLGIYWFSQMWNKFRLRVHPDGTYVVRFPPIHGGVFSALVFGPILMIALWPLLWPADPFHAKGWANTWKHLSFYAMFHLKHNHYDAYYWGTLHLRPPFPWHFPVVMTMLTFPLVTVVLSTGGFWYLFRQQRIFTHVLWWVLWSIRTVLWGWILFPLLSMILSLALLLPAIVMGVVWVVLQILESISHLVPGGAGESVRRGLGWLRTYSQDLMRDVRHWNPWLEQPSGPREYKPRPVGPADKTGFLWLLNAAIPIAIIAMPNTPIFGGTKHWMPAWPFLALMAGLGFDRICQALQTSSDGKGERFGPTRLVIVSVALAALFLTPGLIGMSRTHPHGLAYYNTLIGGPRGSANWGMQRSFWAPDTMSAIPWFNKHATDRHGRKGRVAVDFHDSNASGKYRNYGYLNRRIYEPWHLAARSRPYRPGDYLAFVHQKWLRTQLYHALSVLNARAPVHGVYIDEVPLITIWKRNTAAKGTSW